MPARRRNRPGQHYKQQNIPPTMAGRRFVLQQVTDAFRVDGFMLQCCGRRPAGGLRRLRRRRGIRLGRWRFGNSQRCPTHPAKAVLREVFIATLFALDQHGNPSLRIHAGMPHRDTRVVQSKPSLRPVVCVTNHCTFCFASPIFSANRRANPNSREWSVPPDNWLPGTEAAPACTSVIFWRPE